LIPIDIRTDGSHDNYYRKQALTISHPCAPQTIRIVAPRTLFVPARISG
jgi:hypothetical protein